MSITPLWPLVVLALHATASAASTADDESSVSIFESDDLILMNPVESTTILMVIIVVGALYELAFEYLKRRPSKFFHTVFESIVEESMLVGILAMVLIFVSSVASLSLIWRQMISNTVLVLLVMVLFFVAFSVATIFWALRVLKSAKTFERSRMDVDPLLSPTEQLVKECRDFFKKSITLHGLNDVAFGDVLFTDYIRERSADTLKLFFDLSWKSWGVLGFFIAGNVIRVRSVVTSDDERTPNGIAMNVGTFVAIMGLVPLAMHLLLHYAMRARLVSMVKKQDSVEQIDVNPRLRLFFSSLDVTASVVSAAILLFEWYLSFFFINLVGLAVNEFGALSIVIIVASLIPPGISLYLLPWTVMYITIMCSVGRSVDVQLTTLLKDAALHGVDFSLLATGAKNENGAIRESLRNPQNPASPALLTTVGATLDPSINMPSAGGRNFAHQRGKRTVPDTIRGNALLIDDEWDTEMGLNLRGESDEESTRESSAGNEQNDDYEPLTDAVLDPSYLGDANSYHHTSRNHRDTEINNGMKRKLEAARLASRAITAADNLTISRANFGAERSWDPLRPMYLPDWRHNPVTAREEELNERREALEEEKQKLSLGATFEL